MNVSESARMHELLEKDRFAAALGAELVEAGRDRVVVRVDLERRHLDASGRVSAGAMFSLADCVMSLISNAAHTSVAVATHFVLGRTVERAHRLEAIGRPGLPRAARPATWLVTVEADGQEVATFTGTTLQLP